MRTFILVCLLQLILAPSLFAAEEALPLSEVVVTASAEATPVRELPVSVQVVDRKTIEKTGATTLDEVLERTLPGAIKKYPGNNVSIGIRGFRSNKSVGADLSDQVLLLVDGHRAGTGNAALIPVGNIERIEIVRGPASVLYGGSAMGGAINVITKRGHGDVNGLVGVEYGSNDRKKVKGNVAGGVADDRFGYSVAGEYESSMDYHDGNGDRYDNTDYENVSAGGSLTYRPSDRHTFAAVGSRFAAYDNGTPGSTSWQTPDARVGNTHDYVAVEYDGKLEGDITLKGSLFGAKHWYEYEENSIWSERSIYETLTTGGRLQVGLPLFGFGRLSTGAEYNHIKEEHTAEAGDVFAPDAEYAILGLFAEHKFDLGDFAFLYGVRYDYYRESLEDTDGLDVSTDDETFKSLNWRGGATWYALDWLSLRASVGTAFTPPTADKLAGKYKTSYGTYIGNPDLEAEKSLTYEIGADVEKWGLRAGLTYFHTDYEDRITRVEVIPWTEYTYDNADGQEIAGFEGYLNYRHDVDLAGRQLGIAPYVTWEYYTTRRNEDSDIASNTPYYLPEYGAVAGASFTYGIVGLDLNGRFSGEQQISASEEMDSFETYNAKLTVMPVDALSVYLAVDNLSDKQYSYQKGYPMPGRTYTVGMEYRF